MSKRKNVHPDHYKTRGSGHQGEEVVQQKHRERFARKEAEREEWRGRERDEPTPEEEEEEEEEKTVNREK